MSMSVTSRFVRKSVVAGAATLLLAVAAPLLAAVPAAATTPAPGVPVTIDQDLWAAENTTISFSGLPDSVARGETFTGKVTAHNMEVAAWTGTVDLWFVDPTGRLKNTDVTLETRIPGGKFTTARVVVHGDKANVATVDMPGHPHSDSTLDVRVTLKPTAHASLREFTLQVGQGTGLGPKGDEKKIKITAPAQAAPIKAAATTPATAPTTATPAPATSAPATAAPTVAPTVSPAALPTELPKTGASFDATPWVAAALASAALGTGALVATKRRRGGGKA